MSDFLSVNPFKSSIGSYYTRGLFYEMSPDISAAIYTLKDKDFEAKGKVYKSLTKAFIELEDPTEYSFAHTYLDGWDHWEALKACNWFKPYLESWHKQVELRIRSRALMEIKARAEDKSSKYSYEANKLLLQGGWKDPEEKKNTKGRPKKEDIKAEAMKMAEEQAMLTAHKEFLQ